MVPIAKKMALDLIHGPLANYFGYMAHNGTRKSKAILVQADSCPR
jgi:hypothetical protein